MFGWFVVFTDPVDDIVVDPALVSVPAGRQLIHAVVVAALIDEPKVAFPVRHNAVAVEADAGEPPIIQRRSRRTRRRIAELL